MDRGGFNENSRDVFWIWSPEARMSNQERGEFLDAMTEMVNLLRRTQAAVQRARSQCHAEIYDHVDLMSKRVYELKVKSEWLQQGVLGLVQLEGPVDADGRQGADRRCSIDRRVVTRRKQMILPSA